MFKFFKNIEYLLLEKGEINRVVLLCYPCIGLTTEILLGQALV